MLNTNAQRQKQKLRSDNMADKVNLREEAHMNTLKEMRRTFGLSDFDATLSAFDSLGELVSIRTGIRIEAMCLAARSFAAKGDRKSARNLLRPLMSREFPSPRFYGYLAASLLELRDYENAAQICEKAAALTLEKRLEATNATSDAG